MAPRRMRRAGGDAWSDPALARVAAWLGEMAGLTFPANRRPGVEDALRRVMSELRVADADALQALLRESAPAREAALDAVTIGETYFFRDPDQLALLERVVLPTLARRPGGPARLQMWSAGCASGEEPYTLAMLVREAGWMPGASVLGTDVAASRLATARRGRYGRWSMRGTSPERLARWFQPQGKAFVIDAAVRRDVEFRLLNLADAAWPSGMDVICCRNVLIYFDRDTIAEVAARLVGALAPDGWLFLGASDPPLQELVACDVVATRAGTLYRPPGAGRPAPAPGAEGLLLPAMASMTPSRPTARVASPTTPDTTPGTTSGTPPRVSRPVPTPPLPRPVAAPRAATATTAATAATTAALATRARAAYDAADHAAAAELARAAVDAGEADAATWTVLVRALANAGRLREAGGACAAALGHFPMVPELLLLHATLLLADDRPADAAAAVRRALYLDRGAPMAHLLLGDALVRTGDADEARRAFRAAERLLAGMPADLAVPHADGETAGRLLRVARFRARPGA